MQKASNLLPQKSENNLERGYNGMTQEEYAQHKADLYNEATGDLDKQDGYNCDECKNKGYISVVTQNEMFGYYSETLKPCKCQKTRNAMRKMKKADLWNVAEQYTFDKYQTPDAWQQFIKQTAMRFCEDEENNWFFIGGQSGAGKSHICTAIATHCMWRGVGLVYMKWLDDIDRIKSYVTEPEKYERLMREFKEAPALYIDDLFKEGNGANTKDAPFTQADVKRTFEIINHRYNNPKLITIISSEKTIPEMLDIDEAFAGRIVERTKDAGYLINLKKDMSRNWRLRGMGEI